MDWDWEDRPPRDTPPPRRAEDEPDAELDPPQPEIPPEDAAPEAPPGPEAQQPGPEHPEDESPFQELPPLDAAPDYVLPGRPDRPEAGESRDPEFDRPTRTVDAAERAVVGAERRDRDQYRPRSAEDRAAARAHRRSQLRLRRLVALAVLVAIVVLVVFLVVRACGGADTAVAIGFIFVRGCILVAPGRQ